MIFHALLSTCPAVLKIHCGILDYIFRLLHGRYGVPLPDFVGSRRMHLHYEWATRNVRSVRQNCTLYPFADLSEEHYFNQKILALLSSNPAGRLESRRAQDIFVSLTGFQAKNQRC
jgi:hypothetical protein